MCVYSAYFEVSSLKGPVTTRERDCTEVVVWPSCPVVSTNIVGSFVPDCAATLEVYNQWPDTIQLQNFVVEILVNLLVNC